MDSLQSCLSALSPEVRLRIASHHGLTEGEITPLVERLTNPSYLQELYNGLTDIEKSALRIQLFQGGEGFFHQSVLCQERHELTPSQLRLGLARLRQLGLLFAHRATTWEEPHYFCPRDLYAAWLSALIDLPSLSSSPQKIHSIHGSFNGIGHDLFYFLIYVGREGVPLTLEGKIYKRMLKKIDLELEMDAKWLEDTLWGRGELPGSVAMMMDLAADLELTREENGGLVLHPDRVAAWLRLGWTESSRLLFSWTKKKLLSKQPTWNTLWWIMEQQAEDWVSVTETIVAWSEVTRRWYREQKESSEEILRQLLRPLCGLGWIEIGEAAEGLFWRWKIPVPWIKEPLFAEGGYVKADFEVFVPAYYPLDQRWMLAQFADYAGGEQMHVYLLSAKSVARGKERGMKEQEMVSVLERLSLTPLPQNVTERILQWGHRHQNIFFREVVVMEGEADAEWVAHSVVEKHAEKIGPTRFLVEKNKVEKLATALQNKGYKVSWLDKEEDPIWKRPSCLLEMNWLPSKYVPEVVDEYPDLEKAIPGLSSLPQMWKAGLRAYHCATVRDMIRKATQFQLDLLIEPAHDCPTKFTPIQIHNVNGNWMVEGRGATGVIQKFPLDQIKRLQVMAPTGN